MKPRSIRQSVITGLALLSGAQPAMAHLDPTQHGGLVANSSHVFGLDYVLSTIVLIAIVVAVGVALWRARRDVAHAHSRAKAPKPK